MSREEFNATPIYDAAMKASPVTPWTPIPDPASWHLDVWQEPKPRKAKSRQSAAVNGGAG